MDTHCTPLGVSQQTSSSSSHIVSGRVWARPQSLTDTHCTPLGVSQQTSSSSSQSSSGCTWDGSQSLEGTNIGPWSVLQQTSSTPIQASSATTAPFPSWQTPRLMVEGSCPSSSQQISSQNWEGAGRPEDSWHAPGFATS